VVFKRKFVLQNRQLSLAANRYQKPVDDKKQRTELTLNIPNPSRPTAHFSTFPFFQPRQATALKM